MGNLTIAMIFVVMVNLLLWFSQIAMLNINPSGTYCYNVDKSILGNMIHTNLTNDDVINQLPGAQETVQSGSLTGFVTDLFNNILGWIKGVTGFNYVWNILKAPYVILGCLNLPGEFMAGIGTAWYLISFFIILAYLWWRD